MPRGVPNGLVRTQLPWMRDVVVGSVLKSRSGAWRVVREVCRYKNGDLRSVAFAIKRCSWTGRGYTIYGYTDLRCMGYGMVPVKPRTLRSRLDRRIAKAISGREFPPNYTVTCCDVEGVA